MLLIVPTENYKRDAQFVKVSHI